jgi:ABC-type polysaccharide/polyol phosphate transport system ATPase subunit
MDNDIAIHVEGVSKRFRLRQRGSASLKSLALEVLRGRGGRQELWALREVSFDVPRGRTLGIIGANGAGKSTLLALLAGTMAPTSGRMETRGTVSSLLELGAGFHPDLSGRENVYLAGAIMGLTREQMRRRFDAILAFADIGRFIDEPVKHYSSGMYVRLGFAVAVEVDPDILLIDEVLAVGDVAFQKKCLRRMAEFREQRKTMLIISHDLHTIQSISDEILFLDHGQVKGMGAPQTVIDQYESFSLGQAGTGMRREWGTGEVMLQGATFTDDAGEAETRFAWSQAINVRLDYAVRKAVGPCVFGFAVSDEQGRLVCGSNTQIEGVEVPALGGRGTVHLRLPELTLATGTYLFSFSVHSADHSANYHRLDHAYAIVVQAPRRFEGCCYLPSEWTFTTGREST